MAETSKLPCYRRIYRWRQTNVSVLASIRCAPHDIDWRPPSQLSRAGAPLDLP